MFEERFTGRVPDLGWRLVCLGLSGAFGGCEPGSSLSTFPARGVPKPSAKWEVASQSPSFGGPAAASGLPGPMGAAGPRR